jgi:Fuc2NAc and GlcNAc transferase
MEKSWQEESSMDSVVRFIETYKYHILYLANIVIGFLGAYLIQSSFLRARLINAPNKRDSHSELIPRGAGIGILLAFMLSGLVLRLPTTMIYAVIIVGFVSFYEDHFSTPVKFRLYVQFATGILFLFPFIAAERAMGLIGFISVGIFVILIVGTANLFNFMDGINGIAGITAAVGFGLLWFDNSIVEKKVVGETAPIAILAACIAISCLGFLPLNVPKARAFLGDVGSITLGFLFGGLSVYLAKSPFDLLCLLGFLIPFYMDEAISVIKRIRKGQSLLIPHREHLYQFLANEMHIPHWKISLSYGSAQIVLGAAVILLKPNGPALIILIWVGSFLGMAILYWAVGKKISGRKSL